MNLKISSKSFKKQLIILLELKIENNDLFISLLKITIIKGRSSEK